MIKLSEYSYKNVLDQGPNGAISSESGQGLIEMVLVLLLSLSVVGGVVYQFGTAFGSFTEDYFGDYLSCLLETGELPTLGNNNGSAAGECDASYQAFSLSNGRPPRTSTGGGPGNQGRNSNIRISRRGGSSGGGFRPRRPQGNADPSRGGSPANQGLGTQPRAGKRKPVGSGEYAVGRGSTAAQERPGKRQRIPADRILKRGGRSGSPRIASLPRRGGGGNGKLRKKKQVQPIRKPQAEELSIKAGWELSTIFRYLIMILILLLLLFVVGFQAMQIKKGMEAE